MSAQDNESDKILTRSQTFGKGTGQQETLVHTHVPIAGEQSDLAQADDDSALAIGNARDQGLSDDSRLAPSAPSCDVAEEPSRELNMQMRESAGPNGALCHLVHAEPTQIDLLGLPKPAKE